MAGLIPLEPEFRPGQREQAAGCRCAGGCAPGQNRNGPCPVRGEPAQAKPEPPPARAVRPQRTARAGRFVLLALLGLTGGVVAMPQFRLQAIQQLHYDKLDPLWQYSGKVMSCTFCHVGKQGGAPWNVFGQALQKGFQANPKSNFGDVLFAVLRANGDSDGDGYPDAIEVFANTLPGDPASRPDKPLAELEQAFAAAGGVAMYAPKTSRK